MVMLRIVYALRAPLHGERIGRAEASVAVSSAFKAFIWG